MIILRYIISLRTFLITLHLLSYQQRSCNKYVKNLKKILLHKTLPVTQPSISTQVAFHKNCPLYTTIIPTLPFHSHKMFVGNHQKSNFIQFLLQRPKYNIHSLFILHYDIATFEYKARTCIFNNI